MPLAEGAMRQAQAQQKGRRLGALHAACAQLSWALNLVPNYPPSYLFPHPPNRSEPGACLQARLVTALAVANRP